MIYLFRLQTIASDLLLAQLCMEVVPFVLAQSAVYFVVVATTCLCVRVVSLAAPPADDNSTGTALSRILRHCISTSLHFVTAASATAHRPPPSCCTRCIRPSYLTFLDHPLGSTVFLVRFPRLLGPTTCFVSFDLGSEPE